jgi:hypothetical protein
MDGGHKEHVAKIRVGIRPVWFDVFERSTRGPAGVPEDPVELGASTLVPELLNVNRSSRILGMGCDVHAAGDLP